MLPEKGLIQTKNPSPGIQGGTTKHNRISPNQLNNRTSLPRNSEGQGDQEPSHGQGHDDVFPSATGHPAESLLDAELRL